MRCFFSTWPPSVSLYLAGFADLRPDDVFTSLGAGADGGGIDETAEDGADGAGETEVAEAAGESELGAAGGGELEDAATAEDDDDESADG